MNLRQVLLQAHRENRSALIPFIMAGDPSIALTEEIIVMMSDCGIAALELGIPFSDPVADGTAIQMAAGRAVTSGTNITDIFALISTVRRRGVTMPICLFSYLNPIFQMGYARFIKEAISAGVQGALIVDLPPEEAGDYLQLARKADFETVFLMSPTTSPARIALADQCSSGFVYYISREGVTGASDILAANLIENLDILSQQLSQPFVVGFGISNVAQIRQLNGKVDGIVIGSAIINLIEKCGDDLALLKKHINQFIEATIAN